MDSGITNTRRDFLKLSGAACLSSVLPHHLTDVLTPTKDEHPNLAPLHEALIRLLGPHAKQIHLEYKPQPDDEAFSIEGPQGRLHITGSSKSALMMGVNWYLKYVAGVSISWNGDCLDKLPAKLPIPSSPITKKANAPHRFALNDTNDGYTGPYWTWEQWERLIDVLALHGINEVLVYTGAEAVYEETFRRFHYSAEELRAWLPTPAHQPWWLLQNMYGWVGPSVSQHLIDSRVQLGAKIAQRLRELGMKPVFPGYFGTIPVDFAQKNPGARVISQGKWAGMNRPDWLDPRCELFPQIAQTYYRVQEELLGPATMFKMDPLHEGGESGGVPLGAAATIIEAQLQTAHPGATWAILGWQKNPMPAVLAGIQDKSRMLILDGMSDRYAYENREQEWDNTPYTFGTIWNFGGHTTIGANLGVWNERYFAQLAKAGSKMNGIAVMPEASCNNPAAFAFFTEMAWRNDRPDLSQWFSQWAGYRYGALDEHAERAWSVLQSTVYAEKSGQWSESQDSLFTAQPSLTAKSACSWSPQEPRYDMQAFKAAIQHLLRVAPSLRASTAYRYDLVDVARQTIANQSRVMLPKIHDAYLSRDIGEFRQLTQQWLQRMTLLNRIVACEPAYLLGPWIAAAKAAGHGNAEQEQLEFDACSLLLEWGPECTRGSGIHDYANREWNGLLEFYRERWSAYFAALDKTLEKKEPVKKIDWFDFDQKWAKGAKSYPVSPAGDFYATIYRVRHELQQ